MYCLVKNDHIYLMNNVESLKHKAEKPPTEKHKISKNYHTRDKLEVRKYRMIDGIDILDICHQEIGSGKPTLYNKEIVRVHLVLRKDNLLDVVWDCIEQGYEPDVLYEAGKITRFVMKIAHVVFVIETQQLRPETIDGEIVVDTAEVYNKMNEAMSVFNFELFKVGHKSFFIVVGIRCISTATKRLFRGASCKRTARSVVRLMFPRLLPPL